MPNSGVLPPWLKTRLPTGPDFSRIKEVSRRRGLNTVCEEARCPNIAECWGEGTATFMVLGDTCTRGCRFCSVETRNKPGAPDAREPEHLAATLAEMRLSYAVITTVCRDDLPDQGAAHIAACLCAVQLRAPETRLEILVQDFRGQTEPLAVVLAACPDVLSHNLETVERLSPRVRDVRAGYRQSLEVLKASRRLAPNIITKSSLMLGLGESMEEILNALSDLREAGVEIVTLGQYLRPTSAKRHLPVAQFVPPEEFKSIGDRARGMGFSYVASGPFVRSSYKAGEAFINRRLTKLTDKKEVRSKGTTSTAIYAPNND